MEDELAGFSVAPNPNCPHVADSTFLVHSALQQSGSGAEGKAPKKNLFLQYKPCSACEEAEETWVCLACSYSGCSRYKKGHMADHANDAADASHACITISLSDLSVWCFQCDEYIVHPKLDKVFREMHHGKFGFTPEKSLHSELPAVTGIILAVGEKEEDKDSGS